MWLTKRSATSTHSVSLLALKPVPASRNSTTTEEVSK